MTSFSFREDRALQGGGTQPQPVSSRLERCEQKDNENDLLCNFSIPVERHDGGDRLPERNERCKKSFLAASCRTWIFFRDRRC